MFTRQQTRQQPPQMALSIVMPVLNEAAGVVAQLTALQGLRAAGVELIVVDGGSHDGTAALCAGLADQVLASVRGRAQQMNAGVAVSSGAVLLFLHADTRLPNGAELLIQAALESGQPSWGRFDVTIAGRSRWLPVVAWCMNLRSRCTGIVTGDQALFVKRETFHAAGGFAAWPLMEDIALSKRLRKRSRPAALRAKVITSGRRWDEHGAWRTIVLMWRLRLLFWLGVPAERLARSYK